MFGKATAWLLESRTTLPPAIASQLHAGLYASLPIFIGGVLNSIAIAAIATARHDERAFQLWLIIEIALALVRLPVLVWSRRALRHRRRPLDGLTVFLSCAWAASVGFGAFISLTSGDWVLAAIICLSAAAMVCGICLRNFGTPRLAATMTFLALTPCALGGLMAAEPIMAVIAVQLPIFMATIFVAAFGLHRMMVSRMEAVLEREKSEFFTRTILRSSTDYTLILDDQHKIVFLNHPDAGSKQHERLMGMAWLDLLPPEDRCAGENVLGRVAAGLPATLVTSHCDASGRRRWFHVAANQVADDSGRIIIVARDISQQKNSEEEALWMALHDPLTGLPNRTVLQDRLDHLFATITGAQFGLLILDIDNFKTINDTLGHDAGDALLCAFAERLRRAAGADDVVTRTGGDEFALVISAGSDHDLERAGERIYAALREPFFHEGRLLECGASIGASLLARDGPSRSEILKTADIALYAAKSSGRGQLKIFKPHMMTEVLKRDEMMVCAREALQANRIIPFFQPKICLKTWSITGFEALLRWTDAEGMLRGPAELKAAFDDPLIGAALNERMIARTLDQMQVWQRAGVPFKHIAINSTAADFRRPGFAERLLEALDRRGLAPTTLQLEVTETVFLGRGAGYVEDALRTLSLHGVRVALDDFGTGYASLSHLSEFPIDILKIDRSFVAQLGQSSEADAITEAVINLGSCLGREVIAEGVETAAQEAILTALGCAVAQGYLYAGAIPAEGVSLALMQWGHPLYRATA
jgi:diguanylate cyclase (GGDEF)-like protein/PAS domain S-box-containing protein